MKLDIKNFAKIKNASIVVDGITVIAGENNTGKSTVGKIIFSLFNSMSDLETKIMDERLKEIESTSSLILKDYFNNINVARSVYYRGITQISRKIRMNLSQKLSVHEFLSVEDIRKCVEQAVRIAVNLDLDHCEQTKMLDELTLNIKDILSLPQKTITIEVLSRYFNSVFHNQINSLSYGYDSKADLELEIKGKINYFTFEKNGCIDFNEAINILHKAVYIGNPYIVDELNMYTELNPMDELLKKLLLEESSEGIIEGVIGSIRAKEKVNDIYEVLRKAVKGNIILDTGDKFYLESEHFIEPIAFHNLSTGLKSFIIIKMLLEKGCLKEKDVLVLDEPEIHLHPQWQIIYAQIIVLLQKYFDLSIIVTTHSPYFLDAIDLFSNQYKIAHKNNYYLSSFNEDNGIDIKLVTDDISQIYNKMASPIETLDSLRHQINNS